MTVQEPQPPQTPPPQPQPKTFSAGAMIGGVVVSLFFGAIGAFIAGMISIDKKYGAVGFLIGILPGALFIVIGMAMRKKTGFAEGLIIGGSIIGLIGGICGAAMVGTSFH